MIGAIFRSCCLVLDDRQMFWLINNVHLVVPLYHDSSSADQVEGYFFIIEPLHAVCDNLAKGDLDVTTLSTETQRLKVRRLICWTEINEKYVECYKLLSLTSVQIVNLSPVYLKLWVKNCLLSVLQNAWICTEMRLQLGLCPIPCWGIEILTLSHTP